MARIETTLPSGSVVQTGQLFKEEYAYNGTQTYVVNNFYSQVYSVEVTGVGALSESQYTLMPPKTIQINDPLEPTDFVVIIYGQAGAGTLPYYTQVQTDQLLDDLEEEMTDYTDDAFIRGAKLYSRTGIVDKSDTFELQVQDANTVLIQQVEAMLFWEELFVVDAEPADAIKAFPFQLYPLSELITATGGNINLTPIVTDGLYIRYLGYDVNGNIISSPNNFLESSSIAQLGFVTVVNALGVVSFLDPTPGARNVFSQPIPANLNDLDRITVVSATDITLNYNIGTPTLSANSGTITGISINWKGPNNPGNTNPIDKFSYLGDNIVDFTSIDANFLTDTNPPTIHTLWTDVVEGFQVNRSYYNTGSQLRDNLAAGKFSIKRVLIGLRGGILIQEGEHATNNGYNTIEEAKVNVYTATFSTAIQPEGVVIEIARIIFQENVTDFSDSTKFFIVGTIGGSNAGTSVVVVNDATTTVKGIVRLAGDLSGTALNPTVPELANKVNGAGSGIVFKVPKWLNSTTLQDSNITDNGSVVTITTGANIQELTIGKGGGSVSSNTAIGKNALSSNTSGNSNVSLGQSSMFGNLTGSSNTGLGFNAMSGVLGSSNTGVGASVFASTASGSFNTGIGRDAGRYIPNGSTANATANNSTFIGANTKTFATNQTNEIVIGYDAIGIGSNSAVLGSDLITKTALKGNVILGQTGTITDNGVDKLQVLGSGVFTVPTLTTGLKVNWGALSFSVYEPSTSRVALSAVSPPSATNFMLAGTAATTILNAPSATSTISFSQANIAKGVFMGTTGHLILQSGGTFTDNTVDRLQITGSMIATAIKKTGGTATQYLMADGSVTTVSSVTLTTNIQAGTTYAITNGDNGVQIITTSNSPVTITIPTGLISGFNCEVLQQGTGTVTFVGAGTTLRCSTFELLQTAERYSLIGIDQMPNLTEEYHIFGSLSSI